MNSEMSINAGDVFQLKNVAWLDNTMQWFKCNAGDILICVDVKLNDEQNDTLDITFLHADHGLLNIKINALRDNWSPWFLSKFEQTNE